MDHESLRTASTYLNNLLLARGLLRNSEPIDFVKPSKESRAQIINLVHDLILREDRDKEQREHVAHTVRQLRADDARKQHDIERLNTKSEEATRAAVQAQAAERVARAEVKKVEKTMKSLQDQAAKLKTTLAQVKTQCANDVRKRDLELARLQTHLQGQQRGNRSAMTAPSMTVRRTTANTQGQDLNDPEYSLKQETTDFLTQLSQSLSDENDGLIGLIRTALGTMKELLGLPANARRVDSANGSMGDQEPPSGKHANSMLQALPTSYETLATDLESTLTHLKSILTNPNFVSMEEVEVREEEIARLREGWEHMEKRCLDMLVLMQGWLKRMNTGDTIKIDDLRRGMGFLSPGREQPGHLSRSDLTDQSSVESESSEIRLPDIDEVTEPSIAIPSPAQKSFQPRTSDKRKRDVLEPPSFFDLRPSSDASRSLPPSPPKHRSHASDPEPVESGSARAKALLQDDDGDSSELEIPQMTVAEKLSAAQEEAEQAAAAARESGPKASRRAQLPDYGLDGSLDELAHDKRDDGDTLGKMLSPMSKRTRINGRARRRRKSTLNPEELESLICVDG
ncbi:hypothetical protein CLAFUW4_04681 [Fulvia fulva]|uniref:Afadin and alpha-actinin-binding-domain-containing protein n=1 Tax=Passalora fulva TaxID=5499 RepID=A0A9Q8LFG7_PASFU|nr:uncharacterized protein CLAFUR5_04642 [Fulvia fulva]KAK4626102.1 hypothetical protein CLAFUR4_04667 [Fulvia fulva]KAK4628620.1 hypothetical protein CLAFUR0_04671 [Fulvia fulva]UJO16451.1 hypothetical protein CLAFUR5_04642 [Fulvia fulva]WPV13642.1 hypothetical protein CLAFUW4_04681 [Fulvia fulva]WPV29297.1 hypothetical protein CLAFUW7_04675 [Fulvia fulva]